jgi:ribonucleoside-diphosphate reductase alpha chain
MTKYFRNDLGELVYLRSYARWLESENRRETWDETVDRVCRFLFKESPVNSEEIALIKEMILTQQVMPSMRSLWASGDFASVDNTAIYNCSFLPIDNLKAFSELIYILMQGTGVGFSVESKFVSKLPVIAEMDSTKVTSIQVEDSSVGWADTVFFVITQAWKGFGSIDIDYSLVRPRGSRLKTKGGRASGPQPLQDAITFIIDTISNAQGRQLTTLEVYDICCSLAEVVVVGGVRRSAMISFSDPDDESLRHAKDWKIGNFPLKRYMSNNSAYFADRPSKEVFDREWKQLAESGSGERGFSIDNWHKYAPRPKGECRSNPCHEIGLRFKESNDPWTGEGGGGQFCNLSAVVVRPEDTLDTLKVKVRLATIIGCTQATFTNFPYLRPAWRNLCQEDRLIGVDLTGQCDNPKLLDNLENLSALNDIAMSTASEMSKLLRINIPAAITCGKPSGNTSQMVDCASGFHPRYSDFYFRHVRVSADDPLSDLLRSEGVPMFPEVGQEDLPLDKIKTWVARFPIKSPQGSMTRDDETSFDQMERYLTIMKGWCKERGHNQSATIYVKNDDWDKVGQWVWDNFDDIVGLSFLPYDGGNYKLAPYEEISEEEYLDAIQDFPKIDFQRLSEFETYDQGQGSSEIACTGGTCEI